MKKLREAIRTKTKRSNGNSLAAIIDDVNRTLRGWFEYFKHSHKPTFPIVDKWVRRRLRSILRKRIGLHGISRGYDHFRWPNGSFKFAGFSACRGSSSFASVLEEVKPPTGEPDAGIRQSGLEGGAVTSRPYPYRNIRVLQEAPCFGLSGAIVSSHHEAGNTALDPEGGRLEVVRAR